MVDGLEMSMIGPGGSEADCHVISQPLFDSRTWCKATVPGTVLTTLVDREVFPDPLFGLNDLEIPEALHKYAWWYRNAFTLTGRYRGKRI